MDAKKKAAALAKRERTKRYNTLRKRVDALDSGDPATAMDHEQAENARKMIDRLEAIEKEVARRKL